MTDLSKRLLVLSLASMPSCGLVSLSDGLALGIVMHSSLSGVFMLASVADAVVDVDVVDELKLQLLLDDELDDEYELMLAPVPALPPVLFVFVQMLLLVLFVVLMFVLELTAAVARCDEDSEQVMFTTPLSPLSDCVDA